MATPIGEDNWLAYLEEETKRATNLEGRVKVVELFKGAISAEPWSLKIWLAYCEYYWSLFIDCQTREAGWPEEEQHMGRELFSFSTALTLWSDGYQAVKYRMNDSHEFWNRWAGIEMEQLSRSRTANGVKRISHLFRDRLSIPHATWDNTSQMFSSFLSEYNNSAYEAEMKEITAVAQPAKEAWAARERRELELNRLARSGDEQAYEAAMKEYLDWETIETTIKSPPPQHTNLSVQLALMLYGRALTGVFAFNDDIWLNFIVLLSTLRDSASAPHIQDPPLPDTLEILRRATSHCPGSGSLWSRYILSAEEAGWGFHNVESIKHAATSNAAALDKNGMPGVIDMYAAWCGYLKRNALAPHASEDAADVAEFGLVSAIEDVGIWGRRLYKDEFQGDPNYRLERILILFLTEKRGDIEGARARWNTMADKPLHGNSYDFWLNYYLWEMRMYASQPRMRSPTPATSANGIKSANRPNMGTEVLLRAMQQKNLDWPERIMEVCHQHCNDYEQSQTLRRALDMIHRSRRRVERRREHERAAAESAYAAQAQATQLATPGDEDGPSSKRKRDPSVEASTNKRPKNEEAAADEQSLKRDRENTSVMVQNLPVDVTITAIRKYFKEYGSVVNVTTKKRTDNAAALVEFESTEDMRSALLRDQKYFGNNQISVTPGTGLTLYVTNYPPSADEDYIRNLFKACGEVFSIRFPSLKYNTHRRFCYVSFEDAEAAAKATALDGKMLDGKYKLVSKYSNPSVKKKREGAVADGRDLTIKNITHKTTEDDLRAMFEKHGVVSSVNILKDVKGQNRGTAHVIMETKEQAESAASALNKAQLASNIIDVEISTYKNHKTTASIKVATPDGDVDMTNGPTTKGEIQARSMAIMGLPDTVNDARVRSLVEELCEGIIKIVLRPDRGGAIVEFKDAAQAGKAMLALDGREISANQKIQTGTVDELFKEGKAEVKTSKLMPQPAIRRPAPTTGQKPKPRAGFVGASNAPTSSSKPTTDSSDEKAAPKSNEDFKNLFLRSKQS
ncbi:Splicing factor [Neopestalotiopsis sp. 37M]|nr:Splicing factor [Neopestalotiopsis sp. 37M]